MRTTFVLLLAAVYAYSAHALAADSVKSPRPIPLTRPEMKQLLEDMKSRTPRIPLPGLTAADQESLGERADSYEARLRYHYLSDIDNRGSGAQRSATGARGGEFSREPDPRMTLDYPFKTMLFWIVSRTNNCQYCLGHQEIKLSVAGLEEDEIAALDCDWSRFSPAQQAAFAFARKLTHEPHLVGDADIDALRSHYTDLQILEMVFSVAGNNSINRWKEGVGVPQSQEGSSFLRRNESPPAAERVLPIKSFLTPTSDKYRDKPSTVAPQVDRAAASRRPPLESRDEVERVLAQARQRKSRLPILDETAARSALAQDWPQSALPQWVRLLANFPRDGKSRIVGLRSAEEQGQLSARLKAQVSWIVARADRAWYAVGEAQRRLRELQFSDDEIFLLDGPWDKFTSAEQAMFTLARNLAATPVVLTDEQVHEAVHKTSPREVVQLVNYITGRAFFDRVTEAAGLPIE